MPERKIRGIIWIVAVTGLFCGVAAGGYLSLTRDLPQIQALESYRPSAITRIYTADHILIDELFVEKRDPVPLSRIPAALINALLTTEDRDFYQHCGLALKGILRAMLQNIRQRRFAQGASTLTQQLTKTLFLTPRKALSRKIREAVLALQMERRYTKDEILTLYLNQIYLGSGAYGVAAAARIYFGKSIEELTLAQCALIAGLAQAPSRYSPLVNPELAIKRRNIVLRQMLSTGSIDETAYLNAIAEKLPDLKQKPKVSAAPYFMDYIKKELEDTIGDAQVYKGGLTVYTTLSHQLQIAAQAALAKGVGQLQARMDQSRKGNPSAQAALVAIDVATGGITAMIGGREAHRNVFNRAVEARRQPGSAFKPIIYASAIERGFHPDQTLLDAPVVFGGPGRGQDWQPENFSQTYEGEITLLWALANSKNIPAVRLLEKMGPFSVVEFGQKLGIDSPLNPDLSLALGTSEVRLLELTAAYAVFANQGKYIAPYGVLKVIDAEGRTLWQAKPEQHIAMSRSSAAIITNMLEAVIRNGTAASAQVLPGPLAGKTGTTNDYKDAVFIGYSPSMAAGVWVGNDDATSLGSGETGARAALPIWIDFMAKAVSRRPQRYFDIPDDVHPIYIHPRTGRPMPADAEAAVKVLVKKSSP